ncbi:glycosyl transferase family protein [mine drainage metagenome]
MGDGGSISLGYLAGSLALWAERDRIFPLWVGALAFSPFIVDASLTLLRRLLQRRPLGQAHRDHAYQRLVRIGIGRRWVVSVSYLYMAGAGFCAVYSARDPHSSVSHLLAVIWIGILCVTFGIVQCWPEP